LDEIDASKLRNLAVSETGFVFDPVSGHTFNTNRTGSVILSLLKDDRSVAEIVETLIERFDVEDEMARREVQDFVFRLKDLGLG